MAEWRRGRAVRAYIDGRSVINIAADWGVTRGSINQMVGQLIGLPPEKMHNNIQKYGNTTG